MAGKLSDSEDATENHEINVTPFIDVMLVLLIIFMVVAPLSTVDVPVELPVSQAQPAKKPDKPLFVTLKADLSLAVGNDMVLWGGLASALDAQTQSDRNKRLFLRADKSVPYGELMRLMDTLRAAGYLKVALVGLEGPPSAVPGAVPAVSPSSTTPPPTAPRNSPQALRSMSAHLDLLEGSAARTRRWLIAGLLMVSMHAAAGALAMVSWPEEDTSDETEGAFLLELAPMAMAPPTEKLNLAVGVRSEEAAPAVAPVEEIKEKSEIELPKVEEAPLAPDPEVVLEKKVPLEEVEDEKAEEDPRPAQEALPVASSAAQETSAPTPIEAPPAEKQVAPKQGLSTKPSEATLSWQKSIALHLNKHKKYPQDARNRGHEGVAKVSFSLDRSGKVIAVHLDDSSGSNLLDQEAIEVLSRASPFPRPPSDVTDLTISFSMPIQFRIKH